MPGLQQLRQFSEDVKNLGDEVNVRAQRGERPNEVPLPQGISEADDSQDFLLGLPTNDGAPAAAEQDADIALVDEPAGTGFDELLSPAANALDDLPDLSEFMNDVPEEPDTAPSSTDASDEVPPQADASLDEPTFSADSADSGEARADAFSSDEMPPQADASFDEPAFPADSADSGEARADAFSSDEMPSQADASLDEPALSADSANSSDAGMNGDTDASESTADSTPAASGGLHSMFDLAAVADAPEIPSDATELADIAGVTGMPNFDDISGASEADVDLSDVPDMADILADDGATRVKAAPVTETLPDFAADAPVVGDAPEPTPATDSLDAAAPLPDAADEFSLDSLDPFDAEPLSEPIGSDDVPAIDDPLAEPSDGSAAPAASDDGFDIPDFSATAFDGGEVPMGNDDMFASSVADAPSAGDFELDSDFEIPDFTDSSSADTKKRAATDADGEAPHNTLTKDEYEQFKKNLATYPLNVRIIVEDLISKDEFTDDTVFEVIEKILKKVPARQLAGYLEKLLDVAIDVPRNYERRSVAEYEAYKQSFQYQLRNRILPGACAALLLCIIGYGLFWSGKQFVYKPLRASSLYKQGYALLMNNEYPLAEERFERAVAYRASKPWFFKYARGYRDHKQYERSAQMYRRILARFKHDKQAGLEYATMELYDRANYVRAEEIVRREVLDYHINDSDGLLLLGDVFLEWADIDDSKYEAARLQYSTLVELYGATDLYMSRMMRYFIRTDNLRNVLELKNRFYASKRKKVLGADDWTELSGYMLDKLYGKLDRSDEYLRSSIEDVLDMLETAIRLAPMNPVTHYNLARYFLENDNFAAAETRMETALDLFERSDVRNRRNTYREINAARILGELYASGGEYLKAQAAYTRGINVYERERERSGIEGDANTGRLFADMGDIDYFIVGDVDSALLNYEQAIALHNDTPSLNYRVGAINYGKQDYDKALASFIRTAESEPSDPNLLLALANTLSLRGDNYAAQGYYTDLISRLNGMRATRQGLLYPQQDGDDNKLVDLYLKANNNLGVTLYRLARQTGNSGMNAQAIVRLSDSMRAWDALTRNPITMVRLPGSNLAAQNSKYITHATPDYEPAIYTDIARVLSNEHELE